MKKKNFVRLNTNDNYLSLGNLFRIIKEESVNKYFLQTDLFELIFDAEDVAESTINNYCTGLRPINIKYKNYFRNIKDMFEKNKNSFIPTVCKILDLLNDSYFDANKITIDEINSNSNLKHVCERLYSLSKNDSDVSVQLSNRLLKYLTENNLYNFIFVALSYVILDKKQPIYLDENITNLVEKSIYDTNISMKDIKDYIQIQLNSGIWSLRAFKQLSEVNNPLACFEMASMEYYGIISGKPRYEKAYNYYLTAAKYNHPVATWAIGYLYYNNCIGNKTKRNLYLAFKYFNKARKLNCSNAYNSLGLIILNGSIPHIKKSKEKAISMFNTAIALGNIYAYNNLGQIYEDEKKYKKAIEYYLVSASNGDSWSNNKLGEFYYRGIYVKKDLKMAFEYYTKSNDSTQFTLCPWSNYNLATKYYEYGMPEINLSKNLNKAIELLVEIEDKIIEAPIELLCIYYKLHLETKDSFYLNKALDYKSKCENHKNFNENYKNVIEETLKNIKKITIDIPD